MTKSFLKAKPPDPSPQTETKGRKGKRGKKRKFAASPQAPSPPSSSGPASPTSPSTSPTTPVSRGNKAGTSPPLLPYQLRPSKKSKFLPRYSTLFSSPSSSSMDPFESEQGEFHLTDIPSDEADLLLRDEDPHLNDGGDPDYGTMDLSDVPVNTSDSPTAAVSLAIAAQINEGISYEILKFEASINKETSNAVFTVPTPAPPPPPSSGVLPKPLPLFPNGLPPSMTRQAPPKPGTFAKSYKTNKTTLNKDATTQPNQDTTYAAKAKTPPKARVLVENILYVYNSLTAKRPLGPNDWLLIDRALIGAIAVQDLNSAPIRIVNSGYDATHRCGFIACRDLASANWCKQTIHGIGSNFRAWAKGEQPETRLCRLFFPDRFESIPDDSLIPILAKYNPPFRSGSLILKNVEEVQNGRAAFIEFDLAAYSHVRAVRHKVEFMMQDIDCQVYVPKRPAQGPGLSGITKLPPTQPPVASAPAVAAVAVGAVPVVTAVSNNVVSSKDPRQRALPPLLPSKTPTQVSLVEPGKKRTRPESVPGKDEAKKSLCSN